MSETLRSVAVECLQEEQTALKVSRTQKYYQQYLQEQHPIDEDEIFDKRTLIPGRPEKPVLVIPSTVPKRGVQSIESRIALMHAIAHIEFNAINLAWDAVARFEKMPKDYYCDWARVAYEESIHFELLQGYLSQHGSYYGAFEAHDGLWQMAERTGHDILARMAIVPRVLEARGLDVTPAMIKRFENVNDTDAVNILTRIYQDEIGHVEIGSRWFRYVCEQRTLDSETQFKQLIDEYFSDKLRGPFNIPARISAGFSDNEIQWLKSI